MSMRLAQIRSESPRGITVCGLILALSLGLVACQKAPPRSYSFFMEDRIAREGTLARCASNSEEVHGDIECANAERADAELALQAERARAAEYEVESERRMTQLRLQLAESERMARDAEIESLRRELEAYESMWRSQNRVESDDVVNDRQIGPVRIVE